jgi:CheY-like chemotaxis protein
MTMHRPVEILLVEDSPADARLAREALMQGPVLKRISIVGDGARAIEFLRQRGEYAEAPRPDIVLLDLNLPKRDGLEVLTEVKSDPALRSITVIVLTTSSFPRDVIKAYELLANCYIVKPIDLDHFYAVMRGIEEFWMTMACLPSSGQDPFGRLGQQSGKGSVREPKKGGATAHSHASGRVRANSRWVCGISLVRRAAR